MRHFGPLPSVGVTSSVRTSGYVSPVAIAALGGSVDGASPFAAILIINEGSAAAPINVSVAMIGVPSGACHL